jgi:hypothetical protein
VYRLSRSKMAFEGSIVVVRASMFKIKIIFVLPIQCTCVPYDSHNIRLFFGTAFLIEIRCVLCGVGTES